MGGRLAYVAAATAGVDAASCWYGGGIHNQLDLAPRIACPIQFHYAAEDPHIPPEAVEKVKAAFAGRDAEFHVYPGANHGFNCWARGSYDLPSAMLAHGRTLQFFATHLLAALTADGHAPRRPRDALAARFAPYRHAEPGTPFDLAAVDPARSRSRPAPRRATRTPSSGSRSSSTSCRTCSTPTAASSCWWCCRAPTPAARTARCAACSAA